MAALPSDELSTLIGVLLGRGIDRRHVRRIVAETWRRGGSVSDAEARLTADFGLELPPRSEISANLRAVDRLMLRVVRLSDAEYPPCLQAVPDPPVALFVRGFVAALSGAMSVAVVGSRRATVAGRLLARALAADLGRAGVTVVSGLAVGIDGSAHRGALDVKARTVAVMGGGHNRIYPTSHRGLAEEVITGTGAIVAEYPPTAAPMRGNFPERNRIISGLVAGVVVVEATVRSGTLITARMALEQGREVMAVPGPVMEGRHGGCHRLIRQGAALVEDAADVLEVFGLEPGEAHGFDVPKDAKLSQVLASVPPVVTPIHDIVMSLAMPVDEVLGALVALEIEGFVESHRGGYIRRPQAIRDTR